MFGSWAVIVASGVMIHGSGVLNSATVCLHLKVQRWHVGIVQQPYAQLSHSHCAASA